MKILYVHNEYGKPSGEEQAAGELVSLLREHGHQVEWFTRSSEEINGSPFNLIKSFFTGIYNPSSAFKLSKVLDKYKPDVVQVQNIYPFLSPSIFAPIRQRGIPVVMRCPNYRLFCPYGLALSPAGKVCEKCFRGSHWNCVKNNCASSRIKSLGYAARNAFARRFRWILNGVNVFIVQSEFQKHKFMKMGIPEEKIGILPGISPDVPDYPDTPEIGEWVSFVGRFSAEKGADEFIEAARQLPEIPFKVAGNINGNYKLPKDMPANLSFSGFMKGEEFDRFYLNSRIIAVPSKWYEGFPNVILRGFMLRRPVITTAIGAMDSIVDEEVNGLKIPPGDSHALTEAIRSLYPNTERCIRMGEHGRRKATSSYSRNHIYEKLMHIYEQAERNCHA